MPGYTAEADPKITAKALGIELDISRKKAVEVCRAIRGMMVPEAEKFLEDVIRLKRPVPYRKYKGSAGHRRGKGIMAGGYPVKVARAILKVLQNAKANAEYKGLDPDNMRIKVIAAHKGRPFKWYIPRAFGRSTPFFREKVNIEIILESVEEEA